MKRPFMDEFLTAGELMMDSVCLLLPKNHLASVYPYYDLAIWSQTHWKYIDIKVHQLGIVGNPNFKVCFILDKTSMYDLSSDRTASNKVALLFTFPLIFVHFHLLLLSNIYLKLNINLIFYG